MNPLAALTSIALGQTENPLRGICKDCGVAMFKVGTSHDSQPDGWRQEGAHGRCSTCYKRARRMCVFCLSRWAHGARVCGSCLEVWVGPARVVAAA